jgi:hypothetical protein
MPSNRFIKGFYLSLAGVVLAVILAHAIMSARFSGNQAEMEQLMRRPVASLHCSTLGQAADQIGQQVHMPIELDTEHLRSYGVTRDSSVYLSLSNVDLQTALDCVLKQAWDRVDFLVARGDGDHIVITTSEAAASCTRFYDVSDILNSDPVPEDPPSTYTGGLFTSGVDGKNVIADQLTRAIVNNVSFETWRDNGGTVGSMSMVNDYLIVTDTPEVQTQLAEFLDQLKQAVHQP